MADYFGALGQLHSKPGFSDYRGALGQKYELRVGTVFAGAVGSVWAFWANLHAGALGAEWSLHGQPLVIDPDQVSAVWYNLALENPDNPADRELFPASSIQARFKDEAEGTSSLTARVPDAQRWADRIDARIGHDMVVERVEVFLDGTEAVVEIVRAELKQTNHTVQPSRSASDLSSETKFRNDDPTNVQMANLFRQDLDDQGTLRNRGRPNNGIGNPNDPQNSRDEDIQPGDQITVSESILPATVQGTYPIREVIWEIGQASSVVEVRTGRRIL